ANTYYTLDGSEPTTASTPYYGGYLSISSTTTLKFFSVDGSGNAEPVHTETYVIDHETQPPTTSASPPGGTYSSAQYVYLNCYDDTWCANTYYTLDGSEPTTASSRYYGGSLYISSTTTLKFFSVDGYGNAEPVRTETYVFPPDTTPPVTYASPPGGTYASAQYVYLSCYDDTWCANTYYTLDGSEPTTASTPYYGGYLSISSTTTLKFFSVDGSGNVEPVHTETYDFAPDTQAPITYAYAPGGTYAGPQYVYLYCYDNAGCGSTYYTLDGSEPTTASARYSGYLYLSSNTTLKFFSVDVAGNAEPVHTETYVITPDTTPPFTYASLAGGTYSGVQYVFLYCSDNTGCANTYYTLDGSEPTTASAIYPGYLYIPSNTTLKFFSVDGAGNAEPVHTETYVIELPPTDASAQIARIRTLSDGAMYEPINDALVTYTKATTGPSDLAGFFLQGSAGGPAVFVAVDPLTLSPTPQPGDRVYLYATQKATVNGLVEITQLDTGLFYVYSRGESVEPFRIDASSSDLVLKVGDYESTLISFSGTVASDFASAGTGHVSANIVSLGNNTVSSSLKLRLTTSLQSALDVTQGCSITTNAPLWRFNTQAQPSAWASGDLTVLSCPAPKVAGAASTSGTDVVVAFDRRIDPATVNANGSQFTFDNGLVATSATVTDRQVQLTTSTQVGGTSYRLTVAPSILDTRGSAIDGSANSASFTGYGSTPTPGPAQLRITEVSPGIANGRDLVELVAIKGGSVDGFTLTMGATVMATFPNVQVAAGDVIVVHIKPDSATNGDATGSETTGKSQFPALSYSANYDTAWDFLGSATTEIGYSRRVLRVRDTTGAVQDGAAFGRTGGTPPADFLPQLQAIQGEGAWLPANCGGVSCSDTTTPTALEVSVDWAGCGTTKGGNSVRRVSATDNNVRGDWAVGTPSFGLANP
ncbi:chitobiase/beta-hexosaminidase C-terminal domain-containing protein, partial [Archangium sp.]|uniref:chitobiase/beta-hexosaminidase C-terminal domain-containing protein n=1 Tax=Archangium sp. TaxID=1872627 RepID=UPI00389AA961